MCHYLSPNISVPSPLDSACKSTVYYYINKKQFPPVNILTGVKIINEEGLSQGQCTLLRVSFFYAMRISELIQLTTRNVIGYDRVLVPGLKGSNAYLIMLPGISANVNGFPKSKLPVKLFPFTYMQCYRIWKKAINKEFTLLNGKKPITHLCRYVISEKSIGAWSPIVIGQLLRHRAKTSIQYYI